ncbi:hypothetical protein COU54_00635 [Candidatus Pacearchaeota archaeon CG10_big_fil_rev_8_21_14_0_10_31_24]|nr:MAG: hypothetical protein COU54_00635 [Candidatus Pacearchaeota archaeon CG10_big_fil_rev_8_21_14_0_10_31_24]
MKMIIIIPAHNEEKRITQTLKDYTFYFDSLKKQGKLDYEILVVVNNCKDKTLEIVKSFSKNNSSVNSIVLSQGGKGYAVIEGFKSALSRKFDFIGFVDADESTPPSAFHLLIKKMGSAEGTIASRYIKGSRVYPKQSIKRIIGSRVFNLLARILFLMPYKDTQCGAKLFKSYALREVIPKLKLSTWAFDVDILYNLRKKGYYIREVETIWSDKTLSKISFFKNGTFMALGIIRLRLLNSPFKSLIKLYDKFLILNQ